MPTTPVAMPAMIPVPLPPNRIAELREAASAARWFEGCPERRCRETGRCSGALRRLLPQGPRCYPTCLKLVLPALVAPSQCSEAQEEACQDILARDEGFWAAADGRGDPEPSGTALHLAILVLLTRPPDADGSLVIG